METQIQIQVKRQIQIQFAQIHYKTLLGPIAQPVQFIAKRFELVVGIVNSIAKSVH